jgi:hypothetical protein
MSLVQQLEKDEGGNSFTQADLGFTQVALNAVVTVLDGLKPFAESPNQEQLLEMLLDALVPMLGEVAEIAKELKASNQGRQEGAYPARPAAEVRATLSARPVAYPARPAAEVRATLSARPVAKPANPDQPARTNGPAAAEVRTTLSNGPAAKVQTTWSTQPAVEAPNQGRPVAVRTGQQQGLRVSVAEQVQREERAAFGRVVSAPPPPVQGSVGESGELAAALKNRRDKIGYVVHDPSSALAAWLAKDRLPK